MRGHFPAPYKSLHNLQYFDPGMQKVVQILARNARETFEGSFNTAKDSILSRQDPYRASSVWGMLSYYIIDVISYYIILLYI